MYGGGSADDAAGTAAPVRRCILLPMEPTAGTPASSRRLGGYEIGKRLSIHRGTATYRAWQVALHRAVFITLLPPDTAKKSDCLAHFERLRDTASRLRHENLVGTIDAGTVRGVRYFVTESIEGHRLSDALAEGRRFDLGQCVEIARDVAAALAYLEREGFIHRNVNPASIALSEAGAARLGGLDLAKPHVQDGSETWFDTDVDAAGCLAPEIARGEKGIDARADVYSLGCVLYLLLAGRSPFAGRTSAAVIEGHLTRRPEDVRRFRPDVPVELARLVDRCLRKSRRERPRSALVLRELQDVLRKVRAARR